MSDALDDFQAAFARRIRSGGHGPRPAGVPARRMVVYEELAFSKLRSVLDRCFPVAHACLGEARWARLCRAFFRDWPCRTPWFHEIPQAFVDYLAAVRPPRLPRWLADLARYEWAELAVDVCEAVPPPVDRQGDLLEGVPVVNPAALSLAFAWPVQHIGPGFRPRREAPVQVVVYRDGQDEVRFMALSPATARLLSLLDGVCGGRAALVRLAGELGRPADECFIEFGRQNLWVLRDAGVILGVRP